jgi:hypothetical protein
MDENLLHAEPFREGREAARIGQILAANPYLQIVGGEFEAQAWTNGFKSFDTTTLSQKERARIFFEGWSAAEVEMDARTCPYPVADHSEKRELWMLGYASAGS